MKNSLREGEVLPCRELDIVPLSCDVGERNSVSPGDGSVVREREVEAYAAFSSSERNIWGVCAPKMRLLSTSSPESRSVPSASLSRTASVSTEGTTGTSARTVSICWNIVRMRAGLRSGRTPSCTATTTPSGTKERAFRTEWKRVKPPLTSRWGQLKFRSRQYCRHQAMCASGRTVTTLMPGQASRNCSMVRCSTARPPSSRNCLGRSEPIRVPDPPAVTTRYFFRSIPQISLCKYSFFS